MVIEVALDLVAAQVAGKDVANGEIPAAANWVVMIDREVATVRGSAQQGQVRQVPSDNSAPVRTRRVR